MSLFGKGFKTKLSVFLPCGHLALHPQASRLLPSPCASYHRIIQYNIVVETYLSVLLLSIFCVRVTNNRKNMTVATRCVIRVSKTWSRRVNFVHSLPPFGNRRPQTVETHIYIVFDLCWLCACIEHGQCVPYCMSASPDEGQIKPFFLFVSVIACSVVASCLILQD